MERRCGGKSGSGRKRRWREVGEPEVGTVDEGCAWLRADESCPVEEGGEEVVVEAVGSRRSLVRALSLVLLPPSPRRILPVIEPVPVVLKEGRLS